MWMENALTESTVQLIQLFIHILFMFHLTHPIWNIFFLFSSAVTLLGGSDAAADDDNDCGGIGGMKIFSYFFFMKNCIFI